MPTTSVLRPRILRQYAASCGTVWRKSGGTGRVGESDPGTSGRASPRRTRTPRRRNKHWKGGGEHGAFLHVYEHTLAHIEIYTAACVLSYLKYHTPGTATFFHVPCVCVCKNLCFLWSDVWVEYRFRHARGMTFEGEGKRRTPAKIVICR